MSSQPLPETGCSVTMNTESCAVITVYYTVPLTSNSTALACRARVAREYLHTHTRVLARVHASTRKRTRSRSNACTRFTSSGHASLVPKPSTFFRGGRGLGIDAIDTRSRVLRALVTRAHTRDAYCTRVHANIHTRVARASHACGFRVTREWTRVDRQVARERHCTCSSHCITVHIGSRWGHYRILQPLHFC